MAGILAGEAGARGGGAEAGCDTIDPAHCLLPWPNDHFTRPDARTDTGRRVALRRSSMPRNVVGVPIDPGDYNRSDGFSPGQLIVTKVPGLETPEAFARTGAAPVTDIGRSLDPAAPVAVIEARSGRAHPVWAELDANPADPEDVALLIRPAVNFTEGQRYIVVLRDLRDSRGLPIPAGRTFGLYRDGVSTGDAAVESRRPRFERIFAELERAGIGRERLYAAWDFTVASRRSLTERLLFLRDDAFAALGDKDMADRRVDGRPPHFLVTERSDFAPCGPDGCQPGEDDRVAREVRGLVAVPCYLDLPLCLPGARFRFRRGTDLPVRMPGNVHLAPFDCIVPRSVLEKPAPPARALLFGHGAFASAGQVSVGHMKSMSHDHRFVVCATDWSGMSQADLPNAATILLDLSRFPTLVDRTQQGILAFLHLARLMVHPEGLNAHPAFRTRGRPLIDTRRAFFDGNSQGALLGGALAAVAPDLDRAVLGAGGMNFSTVLRRSQGFENYAKLLYLAYPDELERPLILSMVQMLWDRGEANGYAHHLTRDPLPGTHAHHVLLHEIFGDPFAPNIASETQARTLGARLRQPALAAGRSSDVEPFFGIAPVGGLPYAGSALVVFDSGSPPPPPANVVPPTPRDSHMDARNDRRAREQKSEFLRVGGRVTEVCGAEPCFAAGYRAEAFP